MSGSWVGIPSVMMAGGSCPEATVSCRSLWLSSPQSCHLFGMRSTSPTNRTRFRPPEPDLSGHGQYPPRGYRTRHGYLVHTCATRYVTMDYRYDVYPRAIGEHGGGPV